MASSSELSQRVSDGELFGLSQRVRNDSSQTADSFRVVLS